MVFINKSRLQYCQTNNNEIYQALKKHLSLSKHLIQLIQVMKVWYKLQTPKSTCYKEMTVNKEEDLKKIHYYYNLKENDINLFRRAKPFIALTPSNGQFYKILTPKTAKNKKQNIDEILSNQNNAEKVEVQDQFGNKMNVLLTSLYLAVIQVKNKPVNKNSAVNKNSLININSVKNKRKQRKSKFIENLIGKTKFSNFLTSFQIPIQKIINPPNIINSISDKVRKKISQKQPDQRSIIIDLSSQFCLELIRHQVPYKLPKNMPKNTAKSIILNRNQKYFETFIFGKLQHLFLDKELEKISINILPAQVMYRKYNDPSKKRKDTSIFHSKYYSILFSFLQKNKQKHWSYEQISLIKIFNILDVVYNQCQLKIQIYFDETQKIKKILFQPFVRFSQKLLGRDLESLIYGNKSSQDFGFKGRIFEYMMNSNEQTKNYYKIPIKQLTKNTEPKQDFTTLQDLIQNMSSIGFKMSQIGSILRNFSLIMNLNYLQIDQLIQHGQNRQYRHVKIKQNDYFTNIKSLYPTEIQNLTELMVGQPNYKGLFQIQIQTAIIRKEVLMEVLWQESVLKLTNQINIKFQSQKTDYRKLKMFSIYCHSNSLFHINQLNQQNWLQDGSIQQFQYLNVGRNIIEKQINIENLIPNNNIQRLEDISTASKLKKSIQKLFLKRIQQETASFNQKYIKNSKIYYQTHEQINQSKLMKTIKNSIFHAFFNNNVTISYFDHFFKTKQQDKIQEKVFLLSCDYSAFSKQQNQSSIVMDFAIKVLKSTLQPIHIENIQSENFQENDQSIRLQIINSPHQSINTPSRSRQKQQNYIKNSPIQKNKFFKSNKLKIQIQQLSEILIKTPKRNKITIELKQFIQKYLYCCDLKKINQFFIKKQNTNPFISFNLQVIKFQLQERIKSLYQLKSISGVQSDQKDFLLLKNQLKQLMIYQLLVNQNQPSQQQKQKEFSIQISHSNFINLQNELSQQKDSARKIINFLRACKFRKNNKHYFEIVVNKKKCFSKIYKVILKYLKRQRTYYRSISALSRLFQVLSAKNTQNKQDSLQKIKKRYKRKASTSKIGYILEKIRIKHETQHKKYSFRNLKGRQNFKQGSMIINSLINKKLNEQKISAFKNLAKGLYSLVITSPSGNKKNLQQLQIDVNNVNNTAIIHSGNISTSNVRNSLNQSQSTKGFSKLPFKQSRQSSLQSPSKQQSAKQQARKQQYFKIQKPNSESVISEKQQQNSKIDKSKQLEDIKQEKSEKSSEKQLSRQSQSAHQRSSDQLIGSVLSGSLVSYKSEMTQQIKKMELFQIKDLPFFSFQTWAKDIGAKFTNQQIKPCAILFRKYEEQKIKPISEPVKQIEEDKLLKERILTGSFVSYLNQNLNKNPEESVQSFFLYQKGNLEKPILKHYDVKKSGDFFKEIFNNILKISNFKNSSKKLYELLNLLIKPVKDAYNRQKNANQTVFQDEPLMNSSYDSEYNVLRDEMFLQFAKQCMGNNQKNSLSRLSSALEILSKNYYPSLKLFYPYMNYLKSNQMNKPEIFGKIYQNFLAFAQAIEGYKGSNVKIYKQGSVAMSSFENNSYLQIRSSSFFEQEADKKQCYIRIKLFNQEVFEFRVRNQCFRTIKKRLLNQLGFLSNDKNFALYEQKGLCNFILLQEKQKAIDYLAKTDYYKELPGKSFKINLHLRIKQYYPIKFKDINSLRMFYLNMIGQEMRMPFKEDDYQNVVAFSISFDEFEENRIANFLVISRKQGLKQSDLASIKKKLQKLSKSDNQKKVCEFQYFKLMKEFNFLLGKVYKVVKQKPLLMDQIDKIVIKPKQLCLYSSTTLKSSISLYRIKSFYFENNQIYIDLIYSDRDLGQGFDKKFHGTPKNMVIKDFYRIKELYEDIVYYTQLLQLGYKN